MKVRTFVQRKGEDHSEEVNLDDYNVILTMEMSVGHIRVKGLEFQRQEDKQ